MCQSVSGGGNLWAVECAQRALTHYVWGTVVIIWKGQCVPVCIISQQPAPYLSPLLTCVLTLTPHTMLSLIPLWNSVWQTVQSVLRASCLSSGLARYFVGPPGSLFWGLVLARLSNKQSRLWIKQICLQTLTPFPLMCWCCWLNGLWDY